MSELFLSFHSIFESDEFPFLAWSCPSCSLNGYLYAYCKPNPHARRSGAPMHLFLEIAVESLALRLHGGVIAHENL